MEFARLVSVSRAVAATRARTTKRSLIAALLTQADPHEVELVAAYLSGTLRQRRTGVGWRALQGSCQQGSGKARPQAGVQLRS